jgi:D-alanine transfer protein
MNKFYINLIAFILSALIVFAIIIFNKNKFVANNTLLSNLVNSMKKTEILKNDLENGKIVVFGSSELRGNLKFNPKNYFNKDLKMPLSVIGNAGHQSFAIFSQLASYHNDKIKNNARVVIFLSPGWFHKHYAKGTEYSIFTKYVNYEMMYRLYFQSDIDEEFKISISRYIKRKLKKVKEKDASFICNYARNYYYTDSINNIETISMKILFNNILNSNLSTISPKYIDPKLNYNNIKKEAYFISRNSDSNRLGIHNSYYKQYVEPKIKKKQFPFTIETPPGLENNQEYKDLLDLLDLLKDYKIKPLFIMQDLHPYVYVKNRDSMNPLLNSIKKEINRYGYGYLDMWSYKQEDYEMGTLTDIAHTGELGWVKINQKIIEHFISKTEDKK